MQVVVDALRHGFLNVSLISDGQGGSALYPADQCDLHVICGTVVPQKHYNERCEISSCLQLAWVNLLCFDEAHHATGNHPYALLMKVIRLHDVTVSTMPPDQDAQTLSD
jgi:hypothetical protein